VVLSLRHLCIVAVGATLASCHEHAPVEPPAAPPATASGSSAAPATPGDLPGVVNPWSWGRAQGATDREKAIEDIGPYEPVDRNAPGAPLVNTNAHYWTALVGLAWHRDVNIDFDDEPVDLNGDGVVDAHLTRHIHAPGGILANAALFGLTPTPDDPRGRQGRISISTGVLGLREALRPDGTPSGEIGMTCWVCHGGRNPADHTPMTGLAPVDFDYGLLLATAALLDAKNEPAAEYRRAHGFTPGRAVQARLLMAGPGRQDLINEFGFDVTVPGYSSAFYPGAAHARPKPFGAFNPLSVPAIVAVTGLQLQNWTGSESALAPTLDRLVTLARAPEREVLAAFGLHSDDRAANRRALLTDLRNLATLALQQDSYPGLMWSDAIYGGPPLPPAALTAIPGLYAAEALRAEIARSAASLARQRSEHHGNSAQIARGRALFSERIVGEIANRQILPQAPDAYAPDNITGAVLAPIDPTEPLTARLPVRCADCHSAAPLENKVPLAANPPPLGRCTHCHLIHPPDDDQHGEPVVSIRTMPVPAAAHAEVAYCERCHHQHRDFGPLVYSSSRLFPFDADGDGLAQGDEADDAQAGGIGTEPLIQVETPPNRPPRPMNMPVIRYAGVRDRVGLIRMGVLWVRVPPLTAVSATAPYLHNGSVPTLHALLQPADQRPTTFPRGHTGFVYDTRLPGNRNIGHEYGTHLTAAEKEDLIAFLMSL
jgi:hypothetical protein